MGVILEKSLLALTFSVFFNTHVYLCFVANLENFEDPNDQNNPNDH